MTPDKQGFITVLRFHKDDLIGKLQEIGLDPTKIDIDSLSDEITEDMSDNEAIMSDFWQIIDNHISDLYDYKYQCKKCQEIQESTSNIDLIVHSKEKHNINHNYEKLENYFRIIKVFKEAQQ